MGMEECGNGRGSMGRGRGPELGKHKLGIIGFGQTPKGVSPAWYRVKREGRRVVGRLER